MPARFTHALAGLLAITGFIALILGFYFSSQSPTVPAAAPEKKVAATIFPLYDIVRQIAGERVQVRLIVPPGGSPHTYEPTPSDLRAIRRASAVYAIGHGLDDWAASLAAAEPGLTRVVVDENITLLPPTVPFSDGATDEEAADFDPHYFLDDANGRLIAANIAADLSRRFPEDAAYFDARRQEFDAQMEETGRQIRNLLASVKNRHIIAMHDAWYYFSRAYGLTVDGSFEPSAGREPTPQYLAALGAAVKKAGVRTIYSEQQVSSAALESFARDYNLNIAVLDPESGRPGLDSYSALLIYNASVIAQNQ
ncbi:hypothetical protein A3C96_02695 [Candidatus Uhrbacteria bacterium RIFCSPHIGHO2_02_FULL_60_10]|uniref:Zinc ABC transporter substrate-binding protein n=1 Tax=Candidatus Uhrbacteria bacterium RIFCSPHIGHO2_02_FULL_60_10 TaxID=1802392 RepID=A0A1F7U7Z0_9BACT|nr:MAG: hypothetical protein A3C96_02695 [Candidatus Uhrbacteria bacterium RIFCSPHIGHO2_02_FULL_60_10]